MLPSSQKPILLNPFHPLDLSPQDLLRIYKRFQQSRQINKNLQQQLPIDEISQLIASLKGVKPSYVQKIITQAFIKQTISWNNFLTLLDQQSEIRQKILSWAINQGYTFRYKMKKYYPIRSKVDKMFQFITFMKIAQIGQQKYCICEIDNKKLILINITDNGFKEIDRYQKKNSKINFQEKQSGISNKSFKSGEKSKIFNYNSQINKTINNRNSKIHSQKLIGYNSGIHNLKSSQLTNQDQQSYLKKQRKNIHSVFTIFKDLSLQDSVSLAKITSTKINDRSFNNSFANSLKDNYDQKIIKKSIKIKQTGVNIIPNYQKAQLKLKSLYEQKNKLSYNPYRFKKSYLNSNQQQKFPFMTIQKKLNHQRKQKNYILNSICITFQKQINCLGIAYHNFQIVIVKINKDLNKTIFQQQDVIKITIEKDHKKNQIIESIKFYHHTIKGKWYLLVLIREQYKIQVKTQTNSYILGFQLQENQNKRKGGYNYIFKSNTQSNHKKQAFKVLIQKFQAIQLEIQPKYGLHLISYTGKYVSFHQDYIENQSNPALNLYWKPVIEQKFKNCNPSLSCLSVGPHINKILFGTNNGNAILYDKFSHKFKIKRISSSAIRKVIIIENEGYFLTQEQKFIIYSLSKFQQITAFSAINEDKLHEKIINFEYQDKQKQIWAFGSQIKIYDQQTDQNQLHKKRQMSKTYTWRLNRLKNQVKQEQLKGRIQVKLQKQIKVKNLPELKSSQLIISSERYFIVLNEILQVSIIQKSNLKVKFSFILNVPYDQKVMKIAISSNQKLIAILMLNQSIQIYNIYTQQLYLHVKPLNNQKFISISFLDLKNEYLLVAGTQSGKIAFIPYPSVPQKMIFFQKYSKFPVNVLQIKNNMLISSDEGGKINIWQLPFNVIKNQFNLPTGSKYVTRIIGFYMNKVIYLKSTNQQIFQINLSTLKLNKIILNTSNLSNNFLNTMAIDPARNMLYLVTLTNFTVYSRKSDSNEWILKNSIKLFDDKLKKKGQQISQYGQVIEIGIIENQKAILFYQSGGIMIYMASTQKVGKYINFH